MLPTALLPSGKLAEMRATANQFFTQQVLAYNLSIIYDAYGREIVTSGLSFAVSGYVGNVTGSDNEMLENLGLIGTEKRTRITVLAPFGNQFENDQIVRTQSRDWRVIWTNKDTQDSVQVYEKAICEDIDVIRTKKQ